MAQPSISAQKMSTQASKLSIIIQSSKLSWAYFRRRIFAMSNFIDAAKNIPVSMESQCNFDMKTMFKLTIVLKC